MSRLELQRPTPVAIGSKVVSNGHRVPRMGSSDTSTSTDSGPSSRGPLKMPSNALACCLDEVRSSLHTQASVLQRCMELHPHPPAVLADVLRRARENLDEAIDRSCSNIASALGSVVTASPSAPSLHRVHQPAAWCCQDVSTSAVVGGDAELLHKPVQHQHFVVPAKEESTNGYRQTGEAHSSAPNPGLDEKAEDSLDSGTLSKRVSGDSRDGVGVNDQPESPPKRVSGSEHHRHHPHPRFLIDGEVVSPKYTPTQAHRRTSFQSTLGEVSEEKSEAVASYTSANEFQRHASDNTMESYSHGLSMASGTSGVNSNEVMDAAISVNSRSSKKTVRTSTWTALESMDSLNNAKKMSLGEQVELSEEADFNEELPSGVCIDGVLNPNWGGRLSWDLGVILLVLLDAVILPYQMAFEEGTSFFLDVFWLWLTTGFFGMDMVFSVFTAYTVGEQLVTKRWPILKNYFKTWFAIDFASTIPWGKVADLLTGGGASGRSAQMAKLTKVVKFVRFLRLMRMLRLAKLATIWERVEASLGSLVLKQSVQFARVLCVLTGICHWNACIWWMLGNPSSIFFDMLSEEDKADWLRQRHWTTERHGPPDRPFTWLERDTLEKYIFCFYWSLGVMRTMPSEVHPTNKVERMYVMFFMFFAFSAFAICVALITQTFFKFSERKRVFDEDMSCVRMHMRSVDASDNVQSSVKAYLRHLFDKRKLQAKEEHILKYLPTPIQNQLKAARLSKHIQKLSVLSGVPPKAACYVSEIAEVQDLPKGMCLCKKWRQIEACFIIISGKLVIRGDEEQEQDGDTPFVGDIVDEECLITVSMVSRRTIITSMPVEVIKIEKTKFLDMMKKHEDFQNTELYRRVSEWSINSEDMDRSSTLDGDFSRAENQATVAAVSALAV